MYEVMVDYPILLGFLELEPSQTVVLYRSNRQIDTQIYTQIDRQLVKNVYPIPLGFLELEPFPTVVLYRYIDRQMFNIDIKFSIIIYIYECEVTLGYRGHFEFTNISIQLSIYLSIQLSIYLHILSIISVWRHPNQHSGGTIQ